ncbi:MAG: haloacid dehalogenase-like hydrolase [Polyangiaceae bacterium]
MPLERLETQALIDRLSRMLDDAPRPMLAFDADGTLWRGDVGFDLFEAGIEAGAFREAASEALFEEARSAGVEPSGPLDQLAMQLAEANLRGHYADARAFGMMAWVFAGFTETEMAAFAKQVIDERRVADRVFPYVAEVIAWARGQAVEVVVCSASPRSIVVAGVAALGIGEADVIAVTPAVEDGVLAPRLVEGPMPYAEGKATRLASERKGRTLLAGFGDTAADAHFMRVARQAVAVSPHPKLAALEVPGMIEIV